MYMLYDALRVVTMICGAASLTAGIATLWRPLSWTRKMRFVSLAAWASAAAIVSFTRINQPPVVEWFWFVQTGLSLLTAYSMLGYWREPDPEPPPPAEIIEIL